MSKSATSLEVRAVVDDGMSLSDIQHQRYGQWQASDRLTILDDDLQRPHISRLCISESLLQLVRDLFTKSDAEGGDAAEPTVSTESHSILMDLTAIPDCVDIVSQSAVRT